MKRLAVAVVGPGRAGRARLAALEASTEAELRGLVERYGALRFEAALADPAVEAVLVCTPNALHPGMVRRALEAGKHVCVEYPLASRVDEARELLELAARRGLVLHVEHIELLTPGQQEQRERVREVGQPQGGSLEFSGDFAGWIADPTLAGSPALLALARLNRLVDLFGPARVARAELTQGAPGYALDADLEFLEGGHTRLRERRAPGLPRALRWQVQCERGLLGDPEAALPGGLFALDLAHFVARVRTGADGYVTEERLLHGIALVEEIARLLPSAGC